jgi:hypothetical protein
MKTETVVLIGIGVAAIAAGAIYYAKQKQQPAVNPLAAPTNGNQNSRSAPASSQSSDVANYTKAATDVLSQVEGYFGW